MFYHKCSYRIFKNLRTPHNVSIFCQILEKQSFVFHITLRQIQCKISFQKWVLQPVKCIILHNINMHSNCSKNTISNFYSHTHSIEKWNRIKNLLSVISQVSISYFDIKLITTNLSVFSWKKKNGNRYISFGVDCKRF